MIARVSLAFFLLTAVQPVSAQFSEKANSKVQWNGLGFIRGTNYHSHMGGHCGVYETDSDRKASTLSVAIDCKSEDHKLKTGFVKTSSAIRIIRDNKKENYLRRDLYGYRDCRGREYHFFDGKSYELVNPGEEISIYRVYEQKGKQRVAKLFFEAPSGEIKPLTLQSFRSEYSTQPEFLGKLQTLAHNDHQLVKYLHLINRVWANTAEL